MTQHLLGLKGLTKSEILNFLRLATSFKKGAQKKLAGKKIITAFFEPSTRTKLSFQIAAANLGVKSFDLPASSSMQKGESHQDTLKTLDALGPDAIVTRHSSSGFAHNASRQVTCSVINAGDGSNEHPTQALLDLMTIQESLGTLSGLEILIVGDILHSRVARSNIWAHKTLGNKITLCGPQGLVPKEFDCEISNDLNSCLKKADAVITLRIQFERMKKGLVKSTNEYRKKFGITAEKLGLFKKKAILLHPGPMNQEIEIDSSASSSKHSVIFKQVENGVYTRMAVLHEILS